MLSLKQKEVYDNGKDNIGIDVMYQARKAIEQIA